MGKPVTFKDHYREARIYANRTWSALLFVAILIAILIARMAFLQIYQYEAHITKSDRNRINIQPVPPTRGLIYDRNGILLADNRPDYAVSVILERVKHLDKTIADVSAILTLTDDEIERFKKRLTQHRRPYEAIPMRFNLTEEEIARIAVNQHRLPGVEVKADLVRHYPLKNTTAHAIGYVSRINQKDEQTIDPSRYAGTHHIGKVGIERFYEDILHGEVGYQKAETNARGRILRVLEHSDPKPGKNLTLYLDIPTQEAAIDALGDRRGAIVAIEPKTGGILAFVSTPAYDPNLFVTGIDHKNYNALNLSMDRPLYNRAIQGQYPPGSTIKPFVGLAGLDRGVISWESTIFDPGFYQLENETHKYRDWKKWGHGRVNLALAIRQSCDTFFYDMTYKLGVDALHDFMAPFGFGTKTGIDIDNEQSGLLPSREWKKRRHKMSWFPGETLITGIGQGFMLTTPLQLAVATANLANRGKIIKPRMVMTISTQAPSHLSPKSTSFSTQTSGTKLNNSIANISSDDLPSDQLKAPTENTELDSHTGSDNKLDDKSIQHEIDLRDPNDWQRMIDAMEAVIHHPQGTANKISAGANYRIAGKTGTSQLLRIKQDEVYNANKIDERHRDHALFIGFAPVDNPQIAIAVIVENGGGGGSTAAPVARIVMDRYLNNTWISENAQAKLHPPRENTNSLEQTKQLSN